MVFKYLVLEAAADTMAWKDHLLYREVEAGREVFEIYIYKFLSQGNITNYLHIYVNNGSQCREHFL